MWKLYIKFSCFGIVLKPLNTQLWEKRFQHEVLLWTNAIWSYQDEYRMLFEVFFFFFFLSTPTNVFVHDFETFAYSWTLGKISWISYMYAFNIIKGNYAWINDTQAYHNALLEEKHACVDLVRLHNLFTSLVWLNFLCLLISDTQYKKRTLEGTISLARKNCRICTQKKKCSWGLTLGLWKCSFATKYHIKDFNKQGLKSYCCL